MEESFNDILFQMPNTKDNFIKVIGVGGGGSNAVKYMYNQGIKGVDFIVCNTDVQHLQNMPIDQKLQLGAGLTEGLGAGGDPEIGEKAAQESREDIIKNLKDGVKMLFVTAGMGGGTGTGAAPVIAEIAKEMGILTVGIVTIPFVFEGKLRNSQALNGLAKMKKHVDALIVINNNKLVEIYGDLGYKTGLSKADEVLLYAAKGIAELISVNYAQNIDFQDVKSVLANSGTAIMGSAVASGENRAEEVVRKALHSPLLDNNSIKGAKNALLLILSSTAEEIKMSEISEIMKQIQQSATHEVNMICGWGDSAALAEGSIAITIIATGFSNAEKASEKPLEAIDKQPNVKDSLEMIYNLNSHGHEMEQFVIIDANDVDREPAQSAQVFASGLPTSQETLEKNEKEMPSEVMSLSGIYESASAEAPNLFGLAEAGAGDVKKMNPMDSTIEEIAKNKDAITKARATEINLKYNRQKMNIDQMEKEPAYKRQGIEIEPSSKKDPAAKAQSSGVSLSIDKNNDIQLRSDNSFLFGNVD